MFKWIQDISKIRVAHLVEVRRLESFEAFDKASKKISYILLSTFPLMGIAALLGYLIPSLSLLWFILAIIPVFFFIYIVIGDENKVSKASKEK